ncbi:glycine cleavage system aminomethyltransferase GcvT [Hahella sp. CR1]|uniref:glycine cleavage system aminomethyltransferase GcvT n=1 Tax=Hahella sp. CR1 TaxID=2992807 RepID=UPI002442B82A|nr:glycine cleavage system aminomethyltransferase GcvT [Hahella sp. CR1]MDG9671083.1 glycine cleavage system aminomethyltransferase GcvT [Hahella sp. CR1]
MAESHNNAEMAKTPLYDLHVECGAKMVEFAGYAMPVTFPAGIIKEHLHTRTKAGLFDVSHMGQVRLKGAGAAEALEALVPGDIVGLEKGAQRYTLFTNDKGGILDDLMVTNTGEDLFLVVNAACKEQDIAHLRKHLGDKVEIEVLEDRALLALQGPTAAGVMEELAPELTKLVFMTGAWATLDGAECFVTRSGYTGEDGYEISVPADRAEALARKLLAHPDVEAIGLGARDSLRLEAGLCLYGHDLDTDTNLVAANLKWVLSKPRRADGERAGGFPGADVTLSEFAEGSPRKRVGLAPQGRAPVREGVEIVNGEGQVVGVVTSGGYGPSVEKPVAMGYVNTDCSAMGTELKAIVRGKEVPVTVVSATFVEHRYYRG